MKKPVGDLQQNAHAVACFALRVLAGAVLERFNYSQRVLNRGVRRHALDVDDRADAAVFMFKFVPMEQAGSGRLCFLVHTYPFRLFFVVKR